MIPLLLGLDLGTSACKAGILSTAGDLVALTSQPYALSTPAPAWVEQEPADWWHAVVQATRQALAVSDVDSRRIEGVSIGGQTPGLVLLDGDGHSLRPAIIWQDRRASREADDILLQIPTEDLTHYLGASPTGDLLTTPARLLWLKRHEPTVLDRAAVLLQPKDYINFRLTGEWATDLSSAMGLVNLATGRYHDRYFELLDLPPHLAPPLADPVDVVGRVTPSAAAETGLVAGTPVVAGTVDAMVSLLGCGALEPGVAFEVTGTSDVVGLTVNAPVEVPGLVGFPVLGGAFMLGGPTQAGGQAIEWFLRTFPPPGARDLHGQLAEAAACVPPGANGLVFLPYLAGERTPIWDAQARGLFIGITARHTWADFARAVLEGVAYALAQILALAESCGEVADTLRVCGGAARNAVWNQIKADVTGKIVCPMQAPEAGVVGAAMLAGIGVGLFASYSAAAQAMARLSPIAFTPDEDRHQQYAPFLALYQDLYPKLQASFAALGDLQAAAVTPEKVN